MDVYCGRKTTMQTKKPSFRTGFGKYAFLNSDMCFMFLSGIFHLYPIDNEVEVGESRSSKRKTHMTFRKQNIFFFSNVCRARLDPITARDLMLKSQRSYPLGESPTRFVRINMDLRALD